LSTCRLCMRFVI